MDTSSVGTVHEIMLSAQLIVWFAIGVTREITDIYVYFVAVALIIVLMDSFGNFTIFKDNSIVF